MANAFADLPAQVFWVEIEGRYCDQTPRGWTIDVCATQVTTYP